MTALIALGTWLAVTATALFVFGEDVADSYNRGEVGRGRIQIAAIVSIFPVVVSLAIIISLIFG